MRPLALNITFIILLAYSGSSLADYHYASHSGSDIYPYTSWETAADSITNAMRAAEPYDTIYIGAGDYNELVYAPVEDSCLSFIGAGVDLTRVWEDTVPNLWLARNKTIVKDITFEVSGLRTGFGGYIGASLTAIRCQFLGGVGVMATVCDSITVVDCQFINCDGAVDGVGAHKLVFRNNYFYFTDNNLQPTVFVMTNTAKMIVENNIFICNSRARAGSIMGDSGPADTIVLLNNYADRFGYAFDIYESRNGIAINNTVRRANQSPFPGSQGTSFWVYGETADSVNAVMKNNAATESSQGVYAVHWGNLFYHLLLGYNAFWDNPYGDISLHNWSWDNIDTIGNIYVNPMYQNPDSFDVHLQAYSPLIDAGDPDILDVDGTRSDIGAYGGPGGCSYVYLDLAPEIPDSISARRDSSITLNWRMNSEADFNRYQIFRDTIGGFSPSVFNMISEPDTSIYMDSSVNFQSPYYYRLTSVDNQGNVSGLSVEIAVVPTEAPPFDDENGLLPKYSTITTAYPNPFNSDITIVYSASNLGPQPPEIKLLVYDIGGRIVRTLVNERKEAGTYRIVWDGKDDSGNSVSSGSYIARLYQWGMSGGDYPVKITLVK